MHQFAFFNFCTKDSSKRNFEKEEKKIDSIEKKKS